jgi:integrase
MRPKELFALRVKDCRNGFFHVTRGEVIMRDGTKKAKTTKNDGSVRRIPIATFLQPIVDRLCLDENTGKPRNNSELLLVEGYEDTGDKRFGKTFSGRVSDIRDSLWPDLTEVEKLELRPAYSFRHNFTSALQDAGVTEVNISFLNGQQPGGMASEQYGMLLKIMQMDNPSPRQLESLNKVFLPCVNAPELPSFVADAIGPEGMAALKAWKQERAKLELARLNAEAVAA